MINALALRRSIILNTAVPMLAALLAAGCASQQSSKSILDYFPSDAPYQAWGLDNFEALHETLAGSVFRLHYPAGSYDPGSMSAQHLPKGGAGFKVRTFHNGGVESATVTYRVRFPVGFAFVKGGKLPGLYGGAGNSGGNIPNGVDGFSLRMMWRSDGSLWLYAYTPRSVKYGSLIAGGAKVTPGQWQLITISLQLNQPPTANGQACLQVDNAFRSCADGLLVRSEPSLRIDGLFFDSFFGGNDISWAPTRATYIDFSDFRLTALGQ